ncbi:glycosyltransferase family 1 protein, partial [archaeon]|nr:glycosyltransferase family 1 protein [archaeon]
MRIGIDARVMSLQASGIGRYTLETVKSMAAQEKALGHEFILYPGRDTQMLDLPGNWRYSGECISQRGVIRSLAYPFIARNDRLDVFYSADYLGPVLPMPCRTVITVHDLIPIVYPAITGIKHRIVGKYLLPRAIRNASAIIAVSCATKKDILKYVRVPEEKIRVIYEGKNSSFYPRRKDDADLKEIRSQFGIDHRKYFLFVGSLDPKKNLLNIIRAYAGLAEETRKECVLVLGGRIDRQDIQLKKLMAEMKLQEDVFFTGFVHDEDLPVLMAGARAFCFPSLYEGFGLPVLEALACGCPVITSNVSSLPEVVGDAALLVDPGDIGRLSEAMDRLVHDDDLYEDLKTRG